MLQYALLLGSPLLAQGGGFDARPVWSYGVFGVNIGGSDILVSAATGTPEIYLGGAATGTFGFGGDNMWYVLQAAAGGGYQQVWLSPYYETGVTRLGLGDVAGDARLEIVVLRGDARVELWDQADRALLGSFTTTAAAPGGLWVGNVDADPAGEIVLCDASNLYVYSGTGALEWQASGAGGGDVVAAQMDADAALEIALSGGSVIDAGTRSAQWTWVNGFGRDLDAADIDGDGMAELGVMEDWSFLWAYDVDRQLPKWSISTFDNDAMRFVDLEDDGRIEMLVGDGQWGSVKAYDTVTLAQKFALGNPEHGVTDVAAFDVDGDGRKEILWGAGATSTGPDHFYVGDWQAGTREWESPHLDGPFLGPVRGDLDGDGRDEIVIASSFSDAGYGSGRLLAFDALSLQLRAMSDEVAGGLCWTGVHDLQIRDVDRDGAGEVLVAMDWLYDGRIEIYEFGAGGFTLSWNNSVQPSGAPFYAVDAADVDGDGQVEIVGGGGRYHTGAAGVFVYVYDYASRAEEWHSLQMGGYWDSVPDLVLSDSDGDGATEIAAVTASGDLYVFDGASRQLDALVADDLTHLRGYATGGAVLLLSMDASGAFQAWSGAGGGYAPVFTRGLASGATDGFTAGPNEVLALGDGGRLHLMLPRTGATLWSSPAYGSVFGAATVLGGPGDQLFLSAGSYALVAFQPQ